MNRVAGRSWIMGLFLCVLLGGIGLFLSEYMQEAGQWVAKADATNLYNSIGIGSGTIYDGYGEELMHMDGAKVYSEDAAIRQSVLHWLGDRYGNIRAGAVNHYSALMSGYDPLNGVYDYSGLGGTMELTVSSRVQKRALAAMDGRKGVVAVYNYRTGEILCALSCPSYDPDNVPDIAGDTEDKYTGVYLNRFLQSAYVPGSIFKTVTTAAALECVKGIEDMTFVCYGEYAYGDEAVTCETAHGELNLQGALAKSCNCCFAQIAEKVGRKNMKKYVAQFGVTDVLAFDGVKSVAGNYNIDNTGAVSFAWSAIGQHTDLVNPARFMTFMGTVAAGGEGVEPYIVRTVTAGEDEVYKASVTSTGRIMSAGAAGKLKGYMRRNVLDVYGDEKFAGLTVCAKSGTSQLGGDKKSNAMFAGFVTDDQYPFAFIVVVENGGYGANTCVPVIGAVLDECKAVADGL